MSPVRCVHYQRNYLESHLPFKYLTVPIAAQPGPQTCLPGAMSTTCRQMPPQKDRCPICLRERGDCVSATGATVPRPISHTPPAFL